MPQMGESVVEGTVTKWLVREGDTVKEDQSLCEISTDKVDTEIPSPSAGVIARLVAAEGQTLPIGAVIAVIEAPGAAAAAESRAPVPAAAARQSERRPAAALAEAAPARPAPRTPATAPSSHAIAAVASSEPIAAAPATSVSNVTPIRPASIPAAASGAGRRYSPVVLRMAEEQHIDLSMVPATGLGGRISKRDVERYLESLRPGNQSAARANGSAGHASGAAAGAMQPSSPAGAANANAPAPAVAPATAAIFRPPVYQPREGDTVEPFNRRRKLIAEHMVFSKTHSPHVPTVAEVDLTRVTALREQHKRDFAAREGFALTLLPFAVMAAVRALKEFPRMNASVVGDSLVVRREINLGVAMDAEEGLLVPVIRAAETMSLTGLAREIERLRRKVQDKAITADDLAGGSFTLSNPGREGNLYGFAIINQPQVGILRMGEVKKRPVVVEVDGADAIAIRTMMYLALSYDHRVIDGVLGNRFLYRASRILEESDFEL
ncbi:MAG: 2-oxo acid dehydrogenase subunit E2 [Candidatus Binataceae bacterium]|nr:2-oxo acid dehydrogenase subunit E2 [Candidatus Binataceae bacterium]